MMHGVHLLLKAQGRMSGRTYAGCGREVDGDCDLHSSTFKKSSISACLVLRFRSKIEVTYKYFVPVSQVPAVGEKKTERVFSKIKIGTGG